MGFLKDNKRSRQAIARATPQAIAMAREGADFLSNNQLLKEQMTGGTAAQQAQMNLLGLGTNPNAQQDAFNNFRNSTGYQFRMNEGMNAVTGNQAASGLLNSGATLRALQNRGQNLASEEFGNYFQNLGGMNDRGTNAVNNIGNAKAQAGQFGANMLMQGTQAQNAARGGGGNALAGGLLGMGINYLAGGGLGQIAGMFGGGGGPVARLKGRF